MSDGHNQNYTVFEKIQCHKCSVDLDQVGVSSFGECPECGRKMLFGEWKELQEVDRIDSKKHVEDLDSNPKNRHDQNEALNAALQGERDNLGMALQQENWSLVENTVDQLQELKEKVRAGRIDLPAYGNSSNSSVDDEDEVYSDDERSDDDEGFQDLTQELPTADCRCPGCGANEEPEELNNGSYQCAECPYGSGMKYKDKSEWELVRRSDAESYADDQFLLGEKMERQRMQQELLDLIDQRIAKIKKELKALGTRKNHRKHRMDELEKLREEVEQR